MVLTFDEFKEATDIVDKILVETDYENIREVLEKETDKIPPKKRKEFLNHLNSLFLNVLLNRLDEFGEKAKEKSIKVRSIISEIIKS